MKEKKVKDKAAEPRTNFNVAVRKKDTYDLLTDIIDISVIKDTDVEKFAEGLATVRNDVGTAWENFFPGFREQFKDMRPRIKNKDIEEGLGVEESTVTRFKHSVPAKRSQLIGLCIMYKQDLANTREIITRFEYRDFSTTDLDDCIYTYILSNNTEHRTPKATFERIKNILDFKIAEAESAQQLIEKDEYILPDGKIVYRNRALTLSANKMADFEKELTESLTGFDSFCDFVVRNRAYLGKEDDRIIRRIKKMVSKAENPDTEASQSFANSLFKNKSFREKFYRVIEGRVPITRDFLILLCLHLKKGRADIDEMLTKAGYSILFRKDLLDLMLIYICEWLYVKAPAVFTNDLTEYMETVLTEPETPEETLKREMEAKILFDEVMNKGYTNYLDKKMGEILSMESVVDAYGNNDVMKGIEAFRSLLVTED